MTSSHTILAAASFFFLLLAATAVLVSADLASDEEALLNFAASVPHPPKLNWNKNFSLCSSWIGITCDDSNPTSRVVAVRLPGVGLYGSIPPATLGKLDALKVLSLRSNSLFGTLPSDILSLPSLQYLYLQHNNFSGELTNSLPSISKQLVVLDLSYNSLSGNIPSGIRNLSQITVLYLQNNSFDGPIDSLDLPSVKVVNLSYNNLSGPIPEHFKGSPENSFIGNSLLCGPPLIPCSGGAISPSSNLPRPLTENLHPVRRRQSKAYIIAIIVGCSVAVLFLGIVFLVCLVKRTKKEEGGEGRRTQIGGVNSKKPQDFGSGVQDPEKNKLFFFERCNHNFDLEDLLKASAEVLGKGSFGTAYKAVLEDTTAVVVKRLREVVASKKEFEQQMEVVGKINQHSNFVPLLAYYYSKDEKLLVYKYMTKGSLFGIMHGES